MSDHAPKPEKAPDDAPLRLRLRLMRGRDIVMGPGKADLLSLIQETGSISAAGKRMGMSYKRAWMLVEAMNAAYLAPLVETARGGAGKGGATLTPLGARLLAAFRRLEEKVEAQAAEEIDEIERALSDMSLRK